MGVVVLDVGTSSMRGIVYNKEGQKLFSRQVTYAPVYLEQDRVEQDPSDWISAMDTVLKACGETACQTKENIQAVSITSQRSSMIPIGSDQKPLCRAIMWQDKRTVGLAEELASWNERIFKVTGSRVNPVFSGPKMTWLRRNKPELYKKAERLVVIPDYLIHEMTGEWVTDSTYGSRSHLMSLRNRRWDPEMLELFEVDPEKLCRLEEPGSIVGFITKDYAMRTGVTEGTPVISAGGDQQCAALGMGVIDSGTVEISAGTGGYLIAACEGVPKDLECDVICGVSAVPGQYVLESSMLSCASVFNWMLRLCYGLKDGNHGTVYQTVNEELLTVVENENPLVVLPFFQGRGTPDWNSQARGCIHNITLGTSRADLAKAVMEGIAYEVVVNIDTVSRYTGKVKKLCGCGGLMNSPVFLHMQANICQAPVYTYSDNEATAVGAWISAAVTLGLQADYESAFRQCRKGQQVLITEPESKNKKRYQCGKESYHRLYDQLYGDPGITPEEKNYGRYI